MTFITLTQINNFFHYNKIKSQQINYNGHLISVSSLLCRVPRGSVFGRLFFLLYTAELFEVIAECNRVWYCHAADIQHHICVSAANAASTVCNMYWTNRIVDGQQSVEVEHWQDSSYMIGSWKRLDKVNISELQLQSAIIQFTDTVSDLGVMNMPT